MRKLIIAISLIIITAFTVYPQESSFYDAPFGGGGGYTPFWFVPNVNVLNSQVKSFGVPEFSKSGFFVSGGSGFIYLGAVKNLRIGGMGFGGSRSSVTDQKVDVSGPGSPVPVYLTEHREVVYSLSGGGLTVEYTLPYFSNLAVSVGAILGRGSLDVQLYKNYGGSSWNESWTGAQNSSSAVNISMVDKFWIVTPTLNVDIPAYRMLAFRIGLGYQFTLGDNWTYDNGQALTGVPSNIGGKAFFIQAGIFVGLFSF